MYHYSDASIDRAYDLARQIYAGYGVDTDAVLRAMDTVPLSLHCWQGDDLAGFEAGPGCVADGGILVTGQHPGRARDGDELRQDLDQALRLIPGCHRVNLHAMYAETGGRRVDRDALEIGHFSAWLDWAEARGVGLDFNPTFFAHPLSASGYTLSSANREVREFWVRHARCCREIAAGIGRRLGHVCVHNLWIPDGSKDQPADRLRPRQILREALDSILEREYPPEAMLDALESKLFGIGSESYVVGSHEFYLGYAMQRGRMPCLDAGHFHPTETIADKISALLPFVPGLLLHLSRGVRWDSDHVTILNDDLMATAREVVRCGAWDRMHLALDFFDASINRITAWVVGARAALQALLAARLEPFECLCREERDGNFGNRLALMEAFKALPWPAVWNRYCHERGAGVGTAWLETVRQYEQAVLSRRA